MTILTPDIVQLDYVDRKAAWQSKGDLFSLKSKRAVINAQAQLRQLHNPSEPQVPNLQNSVSNMQHVPTPIAGTYGEGAQ